jgi:hypothetical protein
MKSETRVFCVPERRRDGGDTWWFRAYGRVIGHHFIPTKTKLIGHGNTLAEALGHGR